MHNLCPKTVLKSLKGESRKEHIGSLHAINGVTLFEFDVNQCIILTKPIRQLFSAMLSTTEIMDSTYNYRKPQKLLPHLR